jgi:hypothetical protein
VQSLPKNWTESIESTLVVIANTTKGIHMFNMSMSVGPVNVQLDTDERLSFDAIDTLLNRGAATALTLFDHHLGSLVKYDNYDNDIDCDQCQSLNEELD